MNTYTILLVVFQCLFVPAIFGQSDEIEEKNQNKIDV